MFQVTQLVGRLGADPETIAVKDATIFKFPVATERYDSRKKATVTEWHRAKYLATPGYAAVLKDRLKKGSLVFLVGEHITEEWEGPDGNLVRAERQIIDADQLKVVMESKSDTSKEVVGAASSAAQPQQRPSRPTSVPAAPSPPPPPPPVRDPSPALAGDSMSHFPDADFS